VIPSLDALAREGVLSLLDRHFALTLERIAGESSQQVLVAAALASRAVGAGHVCLDLGGFTREPLLLDSGELIEAERWPALDDWRSQLSASSLVGDGSRPTPLVLDAADRLYLGRYWQYQEQLAAEITARAADSESELELDEAILRDGLERLFGPLPEEAGSAGAGPGEQVGLFDARGEGVARAGTIDWQRVAAILALRRRFCVISGGPGTGKTSTVVKILALLVEQALGSGGRVPRITLVAPTGKAAAALGESIRRAKAGLRCSDEVKEAICEEASTIHRCLGVRPGGVHFRHDSENPIPADLVLVDEASMVDLSLMVRLFRAVAPGARLVLLGDQHQLASVEAGSVLGDVCNTGDAPAYSPAVVERVAGLSGDALPEASAVSGKKGLRDCIVALTRSYRYAENSAIGDLARAVNAGDADTALGVLEDAGRPEVEWFEPVVGADLEKSFRDAVVEGYAGCFGAKEPGERLQALGGFRVLCTHRRGAGGVEGVNARIESMLRAAGLMDEARGGRSASQAGDFMVAGCPVMVTRNDYDLGLFNGDVGVMARDAEGLAGVFFPAPDGEVRRIAPARLPEHESVYAMTVHKSQGSEFDSVVLMLPERASPLLSRELIYTAVTRARSRVAIYGPREVLRRAIEQRIARASGLRDALWG
jgi:exodeoxyribonuclease V alpha subunit